MLRLGVALAVTTALLSAVTSTGCHSTMVRRPADKNVDDAYTKSWTAQIRRDARSGDLILGRGYANISDIIDVLTDGLEVSHAVIYDAQRDSIVEAVGAGVHEVPLETFVHRVHHLVVIRPSGLSYADGFQVVARARGVIGRRYDFGGLIGLDDPDRYYCSELASYAISAKERGLKVERIVIPSHLIKYGEVIFDSGLREGANETGF